MSLFITDSIQYVVSVLTYTLGTVDALIGNENNVEGALAALENSLNLSPWASLVASRYTRMKHYDAAIKSNDGSKKVKGSLSVVHLVSDESDEEGDEETADDDEKAVDDVREEGDSDTRK